MANYKLIETSTGLIKNIIEIVDISEYSVETGYSLELVTSSFEWTGSSYPQYTSAMPYAGGFVGIFSGRADGQFIGDLTGSMNISSSYKINANGTLTGSLDVSGSISNALLSGYREKIISKSVSADFPGGAVTFDASLSNVYLLHLTANITQVLFAGDPAVNELGVVVLLLKGDGTARTVSWGSEITWADGTAPTVVSASNNIDVYTFISANTGSEWLGFENASNQSGVI